MFIIYIFHLEFIYLYKILYKFKNFIITSSRYQIRYADFLFLLIKD